MTYLFFSFLEIESSDFLMKDLEEEKKFSPLMISKYFSSVFNCDDKTLDASLFFQ
jgi:hypothetical protein